MRYLPLTADDRSAMLARIGAGSIDDLYVDVPEAALPAIDVLLRLVAARLLAEDDTTRASVDVAAATAARSVPAVPAHAAMAYLRDRVGVPRDADHPVAHELRCGLNWMCKVLL